MLSLKRPHLRRAVILVFIQNGWLLWEGRKLTQKFIMPNKLLYLLRCFVFVFLHCWLNMSSVLTYILFLSLSFSLSMCFFSIFTIHIKYNILSTRISTKHKDISQSTCWYVRRSWRWWWWHTCNCHLNFKFFFHFCFNLLKWIERNFLLKEKFVFNASCSHKKSINACK